MGKVTLKSSGAEQGNAEVGIELPEYTGPTITISFDPRYLIDYFRAIEEPVVTLEMSDGSKPVIFSCGSTSRYLVMPLAG